MKRLILIGLLICCIALKAEAQKVYKDGSMFVIECVGMPIGSYTKTPKPRTTDGTNRVNGSNTAANLASAVNNEKVAYKFEIAAMDNPVNLDWLSSMVFCAELPGGGNWRMPTQRELLLIWTQYEKLKTLPGFNLFKPLYYLTASSSFTYAWGTLFLGGTTTTLPKVSTSPIRCIRDM